MSCKFQTTKNQIPNKYHISNAKINIRKPAITKNIEIEDLVNEYRQQGNQQVIFNETDLPTGIYFCVLKTPQTTETKKIIKLD